MSPIGEVFSFLKLMYMCIHVDVCTPVCVCMCVGGKHVCMYVSMEARGAWRVHTCVCVGTGEGADGHV